MMIRKKRKLGSAKKRGKARLSYLMMMMSPIPMFRSVKNYLIMKSSIITPSRNRISFLGK
jgi:hypothetical protein